MARQINSVCNFVLDYVKYELLENTVDIEVRVRTLPGTHTPKEDREYCTLKFRIWEGNVKPFEVLKVRLSRYIKRREMVTAAAASVTPIFNKKKKVPKGVDRGQENVPNILKSVPKSKDQEQLRPKVWIGAHILNDPNCKLKEEEGRYSDVCKPNGGLWPSTWANNPNQRDDEEDEEEEEEPVEPDWETD